jgi:hypothetical protein
MEAQTMKLNKKQNNQVACKALITAAKRIESEGVEALPPNSYPFDLSVDIVGELLVGNGTEAGEEVTVIDFSIADVLRGIMATEPEIATVVSAALAWHKTASKEDKKAQDAKLTKLLLGSAKRRNMVKVYTPSPRAGKVSSKPSVTINGSVDQRVIKLGVKSS